MLHHSVVEAGRAPDATSLQQTAGEVKLENLKRTIANVVLRSGHDVNAAVLPPLTSAIVCCYLVHGAADATLHADPAPRGTPHYFTHSLSPAAD